jgi:dihydroneopterin aldolase
VTDAPAADAAANLPAGAAAGPAAPDAAAPDALDRITLTGLRASAFHGVFEEERRTGQVFVIDVTVYLDLRAAAASDDLDRTVHYGVLAEQVVEAVEQDPVDLIETVAERVAGVVLAHRAADAVTVTVHKPNAPITVPFDDVSVTITRRRQ